MKTLIFSLIAFSSLLSQANPGLTQEVAQAFYSTRCHSECSPNPNLTTEVISNQELFRLPTSLYNNLLSAAFNQAQIWGDTILEGDYAADGNVRLDEVIIIQQNTQVLGYVITYSERAWYVGQCAYVFNRPESLNSCEEGRIQETSFISNSFKEIEVAQNKFADFKPKD